MRRRDFFKGIIGAVAAVLGAPLARLVSKKPLGMFGPIVPPAAKALLAARLADMEHSSGAGVLDTIKASEGNRAQVHTDLFYPGQRVVIWSADCKTRRGSRLILDIKDGALVLNSRVPGDTAPGDLILLDDSPLRAFYISTARTGEFKGLARGKLRVKTTYQV